MTYTDIVLELKQLALSLDIYECYYKDNLTALTEEQRVDVELKIVNIRSRMANLETLKTDNLPKYIKL